MAELINFTEEYPFILAFILGIIPALVWLWFWLKEDSHPEPAKMITLSFLGGMLAVVLVLPIQMIIHTYIPEYGTFTFSLFATTEELAKFAFVYFIALCHKKTADEPVDDMIYLIISALGFVTFENTLFLVEPIHTGDFSNTLISGNLRFVGASLLHIMSSATIGLCMALAFYKPRFEKIFFTIVGIVIAIVLHTCFNLFIINQGPENIFSVFGTVWVGIVVLLLLFEKVKHLKS